MKNKVAIIYGGEGCEHEISCRSAELVLREIDREKFEPLPVLITKSGDWLITGRKGRGTPCYPARFTGGSGLMTASELVPLTCAFPVIHGDLGEDGIIQGALRCAGIKYVGCKTLGGALSSDKAVCKTIAESLGIPTASWILGTQEPTEEYIKSVRRRAELLFGYPMFIKPSGTGSSIGMSKIESPDAFEPAYKSAASHGSRVVVEEAVDVDLELECAIFIDKSKEIFTKTGSVSADGLFYDYDLKYKSEKINPSIFSGISRDTEEAIRQFTLSLVRSLDIRQLARADFFLTRRGEIKFNEVNTLPGLTEKSLYPRLMSECGISLRELITKLIEGV